MTWSKCQGYCDEEGRLCGRGVYVPLHSRDYTDGYSRD
jgi:hypothetical protein